MEAVVQLAARATAKCKRPHKYAPKGSLLHQSGGAQMAARRGDKRSGRLLCIWRRGELPDAKHPEDVLQKSVCDTMRGVKRSPPNGSTTWGFTLLGAHTQGSCIRACWETQNAKCGQVMAPRGVCDTFGRCQKEPPKWQHNMGIHAFGSSRTGLMHQGTLRATKRYVRAGYGPKGGL